MDINNVPKYLKSDKVAAIFDVSPRTVTRWCAEGRFPGSMKTDESDGHWRIPQEAVDAFIAANRKY